MEVRTDFESSAEKLLEDLDHAEAGCATCGRRRQDVMQGLLDLARSRQRQEQRS